jgi:Sulfotransferase domain
MSKIVWIASYPKSGNTWVRFLVCNLVFGAVDSAATLSRLAPDIHELGAAVDPPSSPLFMKTHFAYSDALPLAAHTAGAIYVLRDPADVMLSNYHYGKRSGAMAGEDDESAFARYIDSFIAAHGDPRWLKLGMGRWDDNVRSWLAVKHRFPVLRIRYEDLLADGISAAGLLCRALGLARGAEDLAQAVAAASFDSMRRIEETDIGARRVGIFYKPYLQRPIDAGLRFMRSGKSGEAERALSHDQWRRFNDVFGTMRRELGYG